MRREGKYSNLYMQKADDCQLVHDSILFTSNVRFLWRDHKIGQGNNILKCEVIMAEFYKFKVHNIPRLEGDERFQPL